MTWFLIIVAIIALFIYLFHHDKKEILTDRKNKRGSLKERYSVIIDELLNESSATIVSESIEKIKILAIQDNSSIEVEIHEMYSDFLVKLRIKKDHIQVLSKAWKFPLKFDQGSILSKIEKEVNSELDRMGNSFPIEETFFFTNSKREINLTTGAQVVDPSHHLYFEVAEDKLTIHKKPICYWKYQGQQGHNAIFNDENGNIWELNDKSISQIIIREDRKIIYTKNAKLKGFRY